MARTSSSLELQDMDGNPINPATEETVGFLVGMEIPPYDYLAVSYPDSTTEVYIYKDGGVSGTVVATVTIVYTNSTKAFISSVSKE